MLRHFFQHLEIGVLGLFILLLITKFSLNLGSVFLFFISTYLPDLDGLTSIFIWQSSNAMAGHTVGLLSKWKFKEALSYATVEHKKLNRLIFHNLIVYPALWILFLYFLFNNNIVPSTILAALLSHFTFDIFDDFYQLGHIKNWLWPYLLVTKINFDTDKAKPWKEL